MILTDINQWKNYLKKKNEFSFHMNDLMKMIPVKMTKNNINQNECDQTGYQLLMTCLGIIEG